MLLLGLLEVVVGGEKSLMIADAANHAIRVYAYETGQTTTVVGGKRGCFDSYDADKRSRLRRGREPGLNYPTGLALGTLSTKQPAVVYVTDRGNNCIRGLIGTTLWTVAGELLAFVCF